MAADNLLHVAPRLDLAMCQDHALVALAGFGHVMGGDQDTYALIGLPVEFTPEPHAGDGIHP